MPSPADTALHGCSAAPCRCVQRWIPHPAEHHRALRSAEHIAPHGGSTELLCGPRPVAAPRLDLPPLHTSLTARWPAHSGLNQQRPLRPGFTANEQRLSLSEHFAFPPITVRDTPTGNVDNSFELSTYQHPPCGKLRFFYPQRVDSFVDNRWIVENNFFVNLEPSAPCYTPATLVKLPSTLDSAN